MRLLILGGTQFVGRYLAQSALERGHRVTLFHRGETNRGLFPEAETIYGNRDGGLDALTKGAWDAVIDTCGYLPRLVGDAARFLARRVERYTFVSTISVYADFSRPGLDESSPLGTLEDPTTETIDGKTYGPLKVLCEKAVTETYGERGLIIRPGLIVGPHDPTNRFTYWVARIADGGEILAPGPKDAPVQFIDVRDLGEWMLRMTEDGETGVWNATGPREPVPMDRLLETMRPATGSNGEFTWVPAGFLLEQQVGAWQELPLWLPGEDMAGLCRIDIERAVSRGLTFRPLADTIRDTLDWARTVPADAPRKAGLARDREKELLRLWEQRAAG
jgi:2'-hydroxyisoflavone reductase